jgi:hypothetical protein
LRASPVLHNPPSVSCALSSSACAPSSADAWTAATPLHCRAYHMIRHCSTSFATLGAVAAIRSASNNYIQNVTTESRQMQTIIQIYVYRIR